jgi:hypothetical protein
LSKESCEKMIRSIASFGKSPLAPLFQRGELEVEREEVSNSYTAKFFVSSCIFPPLKKGDDRGIWIFSQLQGEKGGFFFRDNNSTKHDHSCEPQS